MHISFKTLIYVILKSYLPKLVLVILLTACGDSPPNEQEAAIKSYCDTAAGKVDLCLLEATASDIETIRGDCVRDARRCGQSIELLNQNEEAFKAMSCGEFLTFIEDTLASGDFGQGCS